MQLRIRNIIDLKLFEGARIAAGSAGIDNPVLWVNVMEILDAPDSLQAGELLITTGYQLEDESRFSEIVQRLKGRGVSGIAIQTGYYIPEIPEYILKSAEIHGLPVIELPKTLTFSHIMHTLLERIGYHQDKRQDMAAEALRQKAIQWAQGDYSGEQHVLFLCHREENVTAKEGAVAAGMEKVKTALTYQCTVLSATSSERHMLLLVRRRDDVSVQDLIFELTILLTGLSEQKYVDFYIGLGTCQDASGIPTAFEQAVEGCRVLSRMQAKRGVCPYQNIDFFELFETIHRNNRSILLGCRALQELFAYDRKNDSAYVRTLRVYLCYECSIVQTARRLYIHRHTLKNRLDKMNTLCGLDLSEQYTRLYLSLALFIHDYFAL